jgi:phosphoribosylaminoimidazolecarboxamide formyltransferase / IMP cyclohydrolase
MLDRSPTPPDRVKVGRALISVSDKTGLVDFAKALAARGIELISTGGTAAALREAGLTVRDVAEVTHYPEMMDGRVKTLHPAIHGGLLALRDVPAHARAMQEHGIPPIDLLLVNLYPFEETVARKAAPGTVIENIDIGGPALIRAAAKNHGYVAVVTEPSDYAHLLAELAALDGATSLVLRKKLAAKAYARTASYDAAIAGWFAAELGDEAPARRILAGTLRQALRYGENPHQKAALYLTAPRETGAATATQLQGKELSYNNFNDTDAAFALVSELDPAGGPAVAIIKHANPCGVARGQTLDEAYRRAFACDSVSAFGGIIAANMPLDRRAAEAMTGIFTEVIIAPGADEEARAVIAKKKNLRLLVTDGLSDPAAGALTYRSITGGFLVQSRDAGRVRLQDLKVVTKRAPSEAELQDLLFAFTVAKHVKSNAIVYAKSGATVGIGAGQMSRVDSARIAALKAQDAARAGGASVPATQGSVVASDAFFPFPDGLLAAAGAGATSVIQPGGSVNDAEVIRAADEAGLAMVFTGMRHFRH